MACACKNKDTSSSSRTTYTVVTSSGSTRTFSKKSDAETYAARTGGKIK